MGGFRFLTAGESHGPGLTVIVEGMPYGIRLARAEIDRELARRQCGYGRGGRMTIERDVVDLRSGVRHGFTIGSPIALTIDNRDFANWGGAMSPDPIVEADIRELQRPRPGHADLAGCLKLEISDARVVLERASARETAARVAAGAVARALLAVVGIEVRSHVVSLGGVTSPSPEVEWAVIRALPDDSEIRSANASLDAAMKGEIDRAISAGDTLGGMIEVVAHTPPPGLGDYRHWDLRLDGLLGQAILSIPSAKGVSIGSGEWSAGQPGSAVHDLIRLEGTSIRRPTNRAGGIEGGVTNGEEIRLRMAVKPLSTLRRPLESIDLRDGRPATAAFERSDVTAVPAAGVVAEAMVATVLADAVLRKFGGDSLTELERNLASYLVTTRRSEWAGQPE